MLEFALLVIAGAWLCLDRTQAFQIMISRPVVFGPVLGLWAGVPAEGAAIGIAYEFLFAGRLPVGSNVPPSDTLAAFGAVGIFVLVPGFSGLGNAGLAAALALPLADWGRFLDIGIRKFNGRVAGRIEALIAQGEYGYVRAAPWIGILVAGSVYGLTLIVFLAAATLVVVFTTPLPDWLAGGFGLFILGLPLLGIAESVSALDVRRFVNWAIGGLAIGIVLLLVI